AAGTAQRRRRRRRPADYRRAAAAHQLRQHVTALFSRGPGTGRQRRAARASTATTRVTRVVIAAGASGGHVYPGLAVAEVLRDRGHDVQFVGGDRLEARVVPAAGFAFHALPVRRPPSVRSELVRPRGIIAMASIARATAKARRLLP